MKTKLNQKEYAKAFKRLMEVNPGLSLYEACRRLCKGINWGLLQLRIANCNCGCHESDLPGDCGCCSNRKEVTVNEPVCSCPNLSYQSHQKDCAWLAWKNGSEWTDYTPTSKWVDMSMDRLIYDANARIDAKHILDLSESIQKHGVLSPITVIPDMGHFKIVDGVHRFRACQLLKMSSIPAVVV